MDIAILVKNITSAFEDASSLVQRIRQRKAQDQDAQTEPIDDLLDSLSLGPTVVRGYYESDARRFGNTYMTGDSIAREQLKDALINLQMTVLSSLGAVILDDKDPDYDAIQAASDDCRVNVGVCLGQLSQRMSRAAKGHDVAGKIPTYDNGQVMSVQRSTSRSTPSKGSSRPPTMTPPDSENEHLAEKDSNSSSRRQRSSSRATDVNPFNGMQPMSYMGRQSNAPEQSTNPAFAPLNLNTRQLSKSPESPISPQDAMYTSTWRARDSAVSTGSSPSRGYQNFNFPKSGQEGSQEGWRPGETGNDNTSTGYFGFQQSNTSSKQGPYGDMMFANLGRSGSSTGAIPIGRRPVASVYDNAISHSPNSMPMYHRQSIPEEAGEKEVYYSPPIPDRSMTRSISHQKTASIGSNETLQRTSTGPLVLPTDKNLLGYCKGAIRLQVGMEKKAFGVANRPLGYSAMLQYWKCEKCYFEGQCSTIVPPGGKKPTKVFDPVIRDHEGIRYKWAFLAKCHVPLKTMPEGRRDGLFGGFGCMFCTAEAAQRGWPAFTSDQSSRRTSVKSVSSIGPLNAGTPVFGNIHGFMEHLQMHRQIEYWPGPEMQGRIKFVVGRAATRGEDFDINLLPLE